MANDSTQHKIGRIRRPRVHITYDLEIGNAQEKKELPLVVGVLADLFGQQAPAAILKDRKFVEIDKGTFNVIMSKIAPKLNIAVPNKLKGVEGEKIELELNFNEINDFKPGNLVTINEPLKSILQRRKDLLDLMAKIDSNDKLHAQLLELSKDAGKIKALIVEKKEEKKEEKKDDKKSEKKEEKKK